MKFIGLEHEYVAKQLLMRTDSLILLKGQEQIFENYVKDWWVWGTCVYLAYRHFRWQITPHYALRSGGI